MSASPKLPRCSGVRISHSKTSYLLTFFNNFSFLIKLFLSSRMSTQLQDVRMADGCVLKAGILNPSDSHKPLLLTCHGAPGLSTHGEPSLSYGAFTDLFRVLVADMRGSGASSKQPPYTHSQWIQDLDTLREWAGAETVTFIGASHGGFLGLEYALTYPERTDALLVGDTAAQFAHSCLLQAYKHALTDPRSKDVVDPDALIRLFTGTCKDMDDMLASFGSISPLYANPRKEETEVDVDVVLADLVTPVLETHNAALGDCLSRYDVRDRLKELKMPVFLWCGRHDWITPVEQSEYLHRQVPQSKLVIYEKSGHLCPLEEKTKFGRNVREFLKTAHIPGLKV